MTLRLVDALMAANKDFDMLIVPNADHQAHVHQAYWLRRRWDYFVRHLHGQQPPDYRIADIRFLSMIWPSVSDEPVLPTLAGRMF